MTLSKTWKKVKPSVVGFAMKHAIDNNSSQLIAFGTGVSIHSDGLIVTAKHVIVNEFLRNGIQVDLDNGPFDQIPENFYVITLKYGPQSQIIGAIQSKPIGINIILERDLAYVRLAPGINYSAMKITATTDILNEGQFVAAAGFPLMTDEYSTLHPLLFYGIISRITSDREIVCDINLHRGNSGGPVFNVETGKLIGVAYKYRTAVVKAVIDDKKIKVRTPTNITYIIPFREIQQGYDLFVQGILLNNG